MAKPTTLKDHQTELRIFRARTSVGLFIAIALTACLLSRLYYLQVTEHNKYITISEQNRVALRPIPPTRGVIYDRHGRILAHNVPSFVVTILKEHTPNLEDTLRQLSKLINLTPTDISRFERNLRRNRKPFEPVPLKSRLSDEEVSKIAVNLYRLPGVIIDAELIRAYPYDQLFSHSVGYVGRISEQELQEINPDQYASTNFIGKKGVEKSYEEILLGKVGSQQIEINARGRIMRTLGNTPPVEGKSLTLFLDVDVQKVAVEALNGRNGAVVAIELDSGGVVALVSEPAYNPNLFVTGIDQKSFDELNLSRNRPLYNRTLQGQYPPGSTIKPMVALGGLQLGKTNEHRTISDPGWYRLGQQKHLYRDWKREGHGRVNLNRAIVESCDIYFYDLANRMGIEGLHSMLKHFNLGSKTGIDIVGEKEGLLPNSQWKQNNRGQVWYPGETLIAGIGQGYMLATPVQMAVMTAITARRGQPIRPHVVYAVDTEPLPTQKPTIEALNVNDQAYWDLIIKAMKDVVHSPTGTARAIGVDAPYTIAGKTGTAQVVAIAQNAKYDESKLEDWHKDHALFVAFAPVEAPRIAVAVIVENGGSGSKAASPVARAVMDAYFKYNPDPQQPRWLPSYEEPSPETPSNGLESTTDD